MGQRLKGSMGDLDKGRRMRVFQDPTNRLGEDRRKVTCVFHTYVFNCRPDYRARHVSISIFIMLFFALHVCRLNIEPSIRM